MYTWLTLQAVLAAIIYVNLQGMMKQFMDIRVLWRSNKVDMVSVVKTIDTVLVNDFGNRMNFRDTFTPNFRVPRDKST